MVFVIDSCKKPLAPCHQAVARKLLKDKKACVYRKFPFTIILREEKELPKEPVQEIRLKIDYGSKHTGLAILSGNKVLWLAQLHHRENIKKLIDDRRSYRRRRRSKNLRYRKPRFLNRSRCKGWIPPSLQSRVDNIRLWTNRLMRLVAITNISYENCKFDAQLMQNAEISGVQYQQGELQGYEVREYLLEKFNRQCVYCGIRDVPLEIEHIIPKSRGGSNRVSNLTISCHLCNSKKDNKTAEEFGYSDIQKRVGESLKDAALVNATRWKVFEVLKDTGLSIECGSGARTKMNRIKLNLPKDHHYDAICIGASTPDNIDICADEVLHIYAKGRGKHQRTNIDKFGFPRGYLSRQKFFFGFQTGDMVIACIIKGKYKGIRRGVVLCRKTGVFDVKINKVDRITTNYKNINLIQKFDGYNYKIEYA